MPKYSITTECQATVHEHWEYESDETLSKDELDELLFAGAMTFVGDSVVGDEENRTIIDVEKDDESIEVTDRRSKI